MFGSNDPIRVEVHLGSDFLFVRVVGEPHPEPPVDVLPIFGLGVGKDVHQPAESRDEFLDVVRRHDVRLLVFGRLQLRFGGGSFRIGLGDPFGDRGRVGSGFQRGAMAAEFRIAGRDLRTGPGRVRGGRLFLGFVEVGDGLLDAVRARTLASQPSTSPVTWCSRTKMLRGWLTLLASFS